MRKSEKEKITEMLRRLSYNEKTHKISYTREDGGTYYTGKCLSVFKKDLAKLLSTFGVDMGIEEQEEREYKRPEHKYMVTLTTDPKAPPVWQCDTLQDVFMNTRKHTSDQQSHSSNILYRRIPDNPFTVVDVMTTYRVMDKSEWCTPEMEKRWEDYCKLKTEFG